MTCKHTPHPCSSSAALLRTHARTRERPQTNSYHVNACALPNTQLGEGLQGGDHKFELTGNKNYIWAAGAAPDSIVCSAIYRWSNDADNTKCLSRTFVCTQLGDGSVLLFSSKLVPQLHLALFLELCPEA